MSEFMVSENIAKIKVIGVGGAGGNAINNMILSGINGVDFIIANTDAQDIAKSRANVRIQLGEKLTKGLGAGANPDVGKKAVEEDKEKIAELIKDSDMLFITAGMGGGTGTGAAPEIAKIAKELGILTVAIVTKPFQHEGTTRRMNAERGIKELRDSVDTLVVIPNDKLFELSDKKITLMNAFEEANNVLKIGIRGISELITTQGLINLDFADVKTIMTHSGLAMLGFGYAEGDDRAAKATEMALSSPLLERPIHGAKRILLNVTGGKDLGLGEIREIATLVNEAASGTSQTPNVIYGTVIDESMEDALKITIIATDFSEVEEQKPVTPSGTIIGTTTPGKAGNKSEVIERRIEQPVRQRNEDYDVLDIPAFIRRKK